MLDKLSNFLGLSTGNAIGFIINAVLFILCVIFAYIILPKIICKRSKKKSNNGVSRQRYTDNTHVSLYTAGSKGSSFNAGTKGSSYNEKNYQSSYEESQRSCTDNIGGYAHSPVDGGVQFNNGMPATEDRYGNLYFSNGESATKTSDGRYYFSNGKTGYEDSYGDIHLDDGQVIIKR